MVAPLLLAAIPAIERLIDRIIPDKEAAAAAKLELVKEENAQTLQELQLAFQADEAQDATNQAEATSQSLFVSGWRPAVGWCCAAAFAYHLIFQPFITYVLATFGQKVVLPEFDSSMLDTILMGMLGLGSLRSIEKIKGVA